MLVFLTIYPKNISLKIFMKNIFRNKACGQKIDRQGRVEIYQAAAVRLQ